MLVIGHLGIILRKMQSSGVTNFSTSKNRKALGLDPARLYVTVFEGNSDAPKDSDAFEIWKTYIPEHRIYFMPAKSNWWSPEIMDLVASIQKCFTMSPKMDLGDMTKDEYLLADERQDVVEIWNDVFMEYEKKEGKVVGKTCEAKCRYRQWS